MNLDQNKIQIFLQDIYILSDFHALINELEKISEKEFTNENNLEQILDKEISYRTREKVLQNFDIKNNFLKNLQVLIEDLKEYISSTPKAEFTLAINPSHELIEEISLWLENTVGKKIIFDIKYDRHIYAGVIIGFNGNYRNFTLRDYINL